MIKTSLNNVPSYLTKSNHYINLSSEYEEWKTQSDHEFYVTEKLDGRSATFYMKDGIFGVCSRNLELLETEDNTFWRVARILDLENKMKNVGMNFSIQGELIGESIQGNPYKIKGQTVRFFNIYDIDLREYYSIHILNRIVKDVMGGLETVPVLETNFKLPETIDELLKYADAKSALNPNFDREGIVIRNGNKSISFKVISNQFLINEN